VRQLGSGGWLGDSSSSGGTGAGFLAISRRGAEMSKCDALTE
jgi:hypothetical protein